MFDRDANLHKITAEDHKRITEAIRSVEEKTSGEVYAVVAHQSDDYFFVSGFMAASWMLLLGLILALVAWYQNTEISAVVMIAAQVSCFAVSLLCIYFVPEMQKLLVPRSIAYRRASNNAARQFMAHGIHATSDRSGVLLFVSLAEHYAEVIADAGINEMVPQSDWDDMVTTMTSHAAKGEVVEGFVLAIEKAGDLLAQNFPPTSDQISELDDRLVEI